MGEVKQTRAGYRIEAEVLGRYCRARMVAGNPTVCGLEVPKSARIRVVHPPELLAEATDLVIWLHRAGWIHARSLLEENHAR